MEGAYKLIDAGILIPSKSLAMLFREQYLPEKPLSITEPIIINQVLTFKNIDLNSPATIFLYTQIAKYDNYIAKLTIWWKLQDSQGVSLKCEVRATIQLMYSYALISKTEEGKESYTTISLREQQDMLTV